MTEARITETSIPAPLTDALSTFVGTFRPALLPNKVKDRTLSVVRDGTGALLAATNPAYSTGRPIANFARQHGGTEHAADTDQQIEISGHRCSFQLVLPICYS